MTIFASSSSDVGGVFHISFADDPAASLGVKLVKRDYDNVAYQFLPGYAVVASLLEGETVASKAGVRVGDVIVAVNGKGFRRFARPLDEPLELIGDPEPQNMVLDHAVVTDGAYESFMAKLKAVKSTGGDPPLVLTLERYDWDARPNAWVRYLAARDQIVIEALAMYQEHVAWRETTFPISISDKGIQAILNAKAVAEMDIASAVPVVYVNYGTLLNLQNDGTITLDDVVQAFVVVTERVLGKCPDPRHPSASQLIDLSGCTSISNFRVDTLKQIYNTFEPNYPETLAKMVLFPVSTIMGTTLRTLLGFVNDKTRQKFLITGSQDAVCTALGWDKTDVEETGGITEFVHAHEKVVA